MESGSMRGQMQGSAADTFLDAPEKGVGNAVEGIMREDLLARQEITSQGEDSTSLAKRQYPREVLLSLRHSPLVGSGIGLEGELWRDLSCEAEADHMFEPAYNRFPEVPAIHDHGMMVRKEEGWRNANQRHKQLGAGSNGSPNLGGMQAWSVGDGSSIAASPERSLVPGSNMHRAGATGWRRPLDIRNENEEDIRRPGAARGSGRDDSERDRKVPASAGQDDGWRPAPPGLGRNSAQRLAPPGLGASPSDAGDRPWGAGRGRLADGERRISGKPRDPPVELPPHNTSRDPQLPEGWNRSRDRSHSTDWRTGRGRDVAEGSIRGSHGQRTADKSNEDRQDHPAWLTAEDIGHFDALSSSADTKRMEFEAEHSKLRGERAASKALGGGMEEISLDEIEAMKQESLAQELAQQQKPSRPQSAAGFEGGNSMAGQTDDGYGLQEESGSRFSRFFNDSSASAPNLPPLASQSPDPNAVRQPSQPLPVSFGQPPQDQNQLQAFLAPRAPSAAGSIASDLSAPQRNLLAQLQQTGNYGQGFQQSTQAPVAGQQMSRAQMERYLLDKNLMSPRSEQGAPGGGLPRPGQQAQVAPGNNSNNLLSLLQGQQGLRSQDSVASQLSASMEPTFANPNPTHQQQQNLLNVLSLGDQQQQQQQRGAGFSTNLLEQLQRMKLANEQQQKQQQYQQQMQLHQSHQGQAQNNSNLLAAFSAYMPREAAPPKQLPDDIFNFNPNHQLSRLPQAAQQPASLGVGKNERMLPTGPQSSSSIAHLLQSQQANQQARALGQQNATLSNGLYNLQPQASPSQLAQLRGLTGQGVPAFPRYNQPNSAGQPGLMGQSSQALGGADPQQIARYLDQQRQSHLLQQAAQQQAQQQQARLINTQRLYQLQLAQQASQQRSQQAQAALLHQQQLQQLGTAVPGRGLSNEGLLRQQQQQQQLLQLQKLQQMGGGNQANASLVNNADPNLLARLFSNPGGVNNLPGRGV